MTPALLLSSLSLQTMSVVMTMKSSVSSMFFGALVLAGGSVACDGIFSGDDGNAFETDCRQICTEYEDCVDEDTNIDDCTSKCVERSVESDNFQEEVDACETCIDDQGCLENVFGCSDECNDVLEESTSG